MAIDKPSKPDREAAVTPGHGAQREVKYEYSPHFAPILEHLGASLLCSPWVAVSFMNFIPNIHNTTRQQIFGLFFNR